jgi:hypothetical protein
MRACRIIEAGQPIEIAATQKAAHDRGAGGT